MDEDEIVGIYLEDRQPIVIQTHHPRSIYGSFICQDARIFLSKNLSKSNLFFVFNYIYDQFIFLHLFVMTSSYPDRRNIFSYAATSERSSYSLLPLCLISVQCVHQPTLYEFLAFHLPCL